jgi:4,5-dihydroxyphthalate decarboxylase
MTAALVARGALEDEYGISASSIRWRCGPADAEDKQPVIRMRPRATELELIGEGENLSDLLGDGELDAMVAYKPPKCFTEGHPKVGRLFPDYVGVEQDYFRRTRIFPIMHLIGIRRDLADDGALCHAVCDAFERAKRSAIDALSMYQALSVALPWAPADTARVREIMGHDYWPYGASPNKAAIDALARYSHAQGLASRQLAVEEILAPAALNWDPRKLPVLGA